MLGNGGKDMNRQLISMRVIDRYKLNPRIHQCGNECKVTGKGSSFAKTSLAL